MHLIKLDFKDRRPVEILLYILSPIYTFLGDKKYILTFMYIFKLFIKNKKKISGYSNIHIYKLYEEWMLLSIERAEGGEISYSQLFFFFFIYIVL